MASDSSGVIWRAPIYGGSGYADESLGVLMGLHEAGIPTQTIPVGEPEDTRRLLPHDSRAVLDRMQHNRLDLARSVVVQSCSGTMFELNLRGRLQIGRTMFESDRLPDGWLDRCLTMDEIWVPSHFLIDVFERAGIPRRKLHVVSRGVNTDLYRPGAAPMEIPHARGFNFLSMFDWVSRKGHDLLLRAFLTEFKADEDVALILKVYQINNASVDLGAKITDYIENTLGLRLEDTPPVILLNGYLPNHDLPRLYAAADCFVLPTRGEGWGQPFMEALACDRPVIATRWSGQVDFLDDENSFLIDIDGLVPAPPNIDLELFVGHCFAAPNVDHLRQLMRHVVTHPEDAARRAKRGHDCMHEHWNWNTVAHRWVREFERLLG